MLRYSLSILMSLCFVTPAFADPIDLTLRHRRQTAKDSGQWEVRQRDVSLDPSKTALIICDMWDKHWCQKANERGGVIAPKINDLANHLRSAGGLIVHAPSDTMKFYADTPQRKLAISAPAATPPVPIQRWCYIDEKHEGKLPIDDSDGGCDDPNSAPPKGGPYPWTRQHAAIQIAPTDAVSDSGQEIYNLFVQRGIKHILVTGVHTNMCVLGRSFGIRQLTRLGLDVILVRDLTDTMYNPARAPFVPHDKGTQLVVEHIEKNWCPTTTFADVLGQPKKQKVAFILCEDEYNARETLPAFAKDTLEPKLNIDSAFVFGRGKGETELKGLEDAMKDADLLVLFMRRASLGDQQLALFKKYFDEGRPLVGIRTANHAFQNWLTFDREVLGCTYGSHHGKGDPTTVRAADKAIAHPLLRGVGTEPFKTNSWLYKIAPLAESSQPLLIGRFRDMPEETVALANTHKAGRIFYTSLGHPDDFTLPQFRRLLLNSICWTLDRPIPE